jgi:hypothetical protein
VACSFIVLLASFLFPPDETRAQSRAPAPADVDSGKVQPLNLKQGCWLVRTHTANSGMIHQRSVEDLRKEKEEFLNDYVSKLAPAQRAEWDRNHPNQSIAAIAAEEAAAAAADLKKTERVLEKGAAPADSINCTPAPFLEAGIAFYGTPLKQCTRTLQSSGSALHAHGKCPTVTLDFDRIDSENVKSVMQQTINTGKNVRTIQ